MVRSLLIRGMLVGILAGLVAFGVVLLVFMICLIVVIFRL